MARPRISVVIATFNGAPFIEAQLQSILEQDRPADEVVLTDDASTDRTVDIARSCLSRARPGVVFIVRENRVGVTQNFEGGIRQATGDLIVLADQDDVWLPTKLGAIEAEMSDPSTAAVFSDARLIGADSTPLAGTLWEAVGLSVVKRERIARGALFDVLLQQNMVTGATLAFRREALAALTPFDPNALHDAWIALILSALGEVVAIERPLLAYRVHDGNTVGVLERSIARQAMRVWRRDPTQTFAREINFFIRLADRLEAQGADPRYLSSLKGKVDHLSFRRSLGQMSRFKRFISVVREARTGSYRRFAHGSRSVFSDICLAHSR